MPSNEPKSCTIILGSRMFDGFWIFHCKFRIKFSYLVYTKAAKKTTENQQRIWWEWKTIFISDFRTFVHFRHPIQHFYGLGNSTSKEKSIRWRNAVIAKQHSLGARQRGFFLPRAGLMNRRNRAIPRASRASSGKRLFTTSKKEWHRLRSWIVYGGRLPWPKHNSANESYQLMWQELTTMAIRLLDVPSYFHQSFIIKLGDWSWSHSITCRCVLHAVDRHLREESW